jgi:AraC family transcriptional regulator
MRPWIKVRKELAVTPIIEGEIGGEASIYAERYLFRSIERSVSGIDRVVLVTQLGGSRVHEGDSGSWRLSSIPGLSMVIPRGCQTHWHYSGAVDFAIFYFPDHLTGIMNRLHLFASERHGPLMVTDPLVGTAALQLVLELQKGRGADHRFMARLADVMLEQVYRVLTNQAFVSLNPRHPQYEMLQNVLNHIRDHVGDELSVRVLARLAGISMAHFRRLFQDAMGIPPHRYVLTARLDQARNLLSMTSIPISRIAEDCGFSSQSHLTRRFREAHAETPAQYRAHLAGPGH